LTAVGATVGAGAEYAFDTKWSARFEYAFIGFQSRRIVLGDLTGGFTDMRANVDWNMHEFVAALNFRF
jgi:opacity protein-like surface antigen